MPFFSELVGRPVVDSANRPVGKLADMVVSSDAKYPIVTAVSITPRHRGAQSLWPGAAQG